MVYIIIAVVLLLIIGPILGVLPSKRQKQQMRMRRLAMAAGISIELTRIDDPDPNPDDYLSNTGKPLPRVLAVVAYRLSRPRRHEGLPVVGMNWAINRRAAARANDLPPGWDWDAVESGQLPPGLTSFLRDRLPTLLPDIVRIEEHNFIISVYWQEQGDTPEATLLIDFLKDCVAQTTSAVPRLTGPDDGSNK